MVDRITIDLTDRQAEIIDWAMGLPIIDHWEGQDAVYPTFDRSGMEKPEYDEEEQTFTMPDHEDLVYMLAHPQEGDIQRYADLAPGQMRDAKARGVQRTANNLIEKIRKASSHTEVDR